MTPEELAELVELLTAKIVAHRLSGKSYKGEILIFAESLRHILMHQAAITDSSMHMTAEGTFTYNFTLSFRSGGFNPDLYQ